MTTFQDPQPQSRRAVRQNERAETIENGFAPFPPNQAATAPDYYGDPSAARELWDTTGRRASQSAPASPRTEAPATSGRRAAPPPPPAAEPLTYATQSRSPVPSYDGPTFQPPPTLAPGVPTEQPQYRVRDFSPEGRRLAQAAPVAQPPAPSAPSDLGYQTEARLPVPPAPQPVAEVPEHTLSRRELRAMQQAAQAAAIAAQAGYQAPPVGYAPAPAYEPVPLQQAPAVIPAPVYQQPVATPPPAYQPPPPAYQQPVAEPPSAFDALFQSNPAPQALPPVAPEPLPNTGLTSALAEYDALSRSQQVAPVEPAPWTPPSGHWAAQLEAEDDPFENTLSRSIGSGHTATNALVLPGMPMDTDIRGPLTSTGEVMLTGSIDLPRSLASTGATATMEHDGIDALFDANDTEINSTDSSPVRAIRAVSTHHSGHGVTHTQKPKGTKALTVLLIAASSMAVVVAGLLIAAFAFNVF